jgi:hypothetical protein
VKKQTLGIPREVIWLELGYTPVQIDEMKALSEREVIPPPTTEQIAPLPGGGAPTGA